MSEYRHEQKYLINNVQREILLIKARGILQRDPYTDSTGIYTIRSLYFDDIENTGFYENENGVDNRAKYRIRYYNFNTEIINLEKKIKCRGMTKKISCKLSKDEANCLISGKPLKITNEDSRLKLVSELINGGFFPKVIVSYERIPFIYRTGNVRITFDTNLSSSTELGAFFEGNYRQRPVFPNGSCVMEVKYDEVLPVHIKETLQLNGLMQTAFSKYYMCRKINI